MMITGFFIFIFFFCRIFILFLSMSASSDAQATGADSGGLIDEEVKTVVRNFLPRQRISLRSLRHSNVDDDEFWEVYLTERTEARILKKTAQLRVLFPSIPTLTTSVFHVLYVTSRIVEPHGF